MGKPRIRGQHVKLEIVNGTEVVVVGEVNKMSVKELGELKKSRGIGDKKIGSTKTFEGYDLSFEGGKVDWKLAQLLHAQDQQVYAGNRSAYFKVTQTFTYYGSANVDGYTYEDVTIHGYNLDVDANDELTEKFEGFSGEIRTALPGTGKPTTEFAGATRIISEAIARALLVDDTPNK